MNYRIVVDSCCDLPDEYRKNEHFVFVPLTLEVDGENIVDDENFNQIEFIEKMKKSENCPKSACPSPDAYVKAYESDEMTDVYVVTLSSKLSGSYNSAELGRNIYIEEDGKNNVYVCDSKSASAGEGVIALKILELCESGKSFEEVVDEISRFRDGMGTYFILESLDNLRKNGRLSNVKAFIAQALHIKPIMGADDGDIVQLDQVRGMNKALKKLVEIVNSDVKDSKNKVLSIAHCNCPDRAAVLKEAFLKSCEYKDIIVVNTRGVSTLYANDGGVVISV